MKPVLLSLSLALAVAGITTRSIAQLAPGPVFVTLGTMGGPFPNAQRSQPANVLINGGKQYLVDVGDGATEQLVRAGLAPFAAKTIFLSHLHFDHTGGLAAFLGLRYQSGATDMVTIYGPPGTKQMVDGLIASMQPAAEAGFGIPGQVSVPPADTIKVVELSGGEAIIVDGITVTAAQNTHYSFAPGSRDDLRFRSLSYRFDTPRRSIVYTGDTGPSSAVEKLARNADLLVSEMIDVEPTIAKLKRNAPNLSPSAYEGIVEHLRLHHLTPDEVGTLAARSLVKKVVITHFVGTSTPLALATYVTSIRHIFSGSVTIANDLDRF